MRCTLDPSQAQDDPIMRKGDLSYTTSARPRLTALRPFVTFKSFHSLRACSAAKKQKRETDGHQVPGS